jgi:hypothetical protein
LPPFLIEEMSGIEVNMISFKFRYLPDFAAFLLEKKLEEFSQVGIRFYREADLPMLRSVAHIPEKDLIALSLESNRELLTALSTNQIGLFIKKNVSKFVTNQITDAKGSKLMDRSEILTEDIILAFYLRRKTFIFFLYAYTQNTAVHTLIFEELDYYTTQEQLLTSKAIIKKRNEETL